MKSNEAAKGRSLEEIIARLSVDPESLANVKRSEEQYELGISLSVKTTRDSLRVMGELPEAERNRREALVKDAVTEIKQAGRKLPQGEFDRIYRKCIIDGVAP